MRDHSDMYLIGKLGQFWAKVMAKILSLPCCQTGNLAGKAEVPDDVTCTPSLSFALRHCDFAVSAGFISLRPLGGIETHNDGRREWNCRRRGRVATR